MSEEKNKQDEKVESPDELKIEDKGFFQSILKLIKGLKPGVQVHENTPFDASMVSALSALELVRKQFFSASNILIKVNDAKTPIERIFALTKFQIGTNRFEGDRPRKPLNPILGELCVGKSKHDDGSTTYLVGEQVSHHPPISAFYIVNEEHEIVFDPNWSRGSATFWGKHVQISITGTRKISLNKYKENYSIVLPDLYIRLFRGAAEYCGNLTITCSETGYVSKIKYLPKPIFGGAWHTLKGKIYHEKEPKNVLYRFEGNWNSEVKFINVATNEEEVVNYSKGEYGTLEVPDLSTLDDKCSEKVWKKFKEHMKLGDFSQSNKAKVEVEEAQRERRKNGTDFIPMYFKQNSEDWKFVGTIPSFLRDK